MAATSPTIDAEQPARPRRQEAGEEDAADGRRLDEVGEQELGDDVRRRR